MSDTIVKAEQEDFRYVKIVCFQILYPSPDLALIIGLAEDNKIYAYDIDKEVWIPFKTFRPANQPQTRGYL